MNKYIPFLKAKSNEIIAVRDLTSDIYENTIPFFDVPRKQGGYTEEGYKNCIQKMIRAFKKHLGDATEIYLDNFDVEDELQIDGDHNYKFLLERATGLNVVPVVSIDRSAAHIHAVTSLKANGTISSNYIACRFTPEDFESFDAVAGEITANLGNLFRQFESVDLILDCRVCLNLDINKLATTIGPFATKFTRNFNVRRIVITGSSIPASVGEVLQVNTERYLDRIEIGVFRTAQAAFTDLKFIFGDYTTISPNYSDVLVPGELMQNVTTAKLIYTLADQHYFIRGNALKTGGRAQYFNLARTLCSYAFYRGANYSVGDNFFNSKSMGIGANCQPNTIVMPSVNAHITYMVRDAVL